MDLVTLNNVISSLEHHNLKQAPNEALIGVPEMVKVLTTIYDNIDIPADYTMISNEFCVDLTLNWLLNVYDRLVMGGFVAQVSFQARQSIKTHVNPSNCLSNKTNPGFF